MHVLLFVAGLWYAVAAGVDTDADGLVSSEEFRGFMVSAAIA